MAIETPLLIISIASSIGMAVIIVEKRDDFPVNKIHAYLSSILETFFGLEWAMMLKCTVCTSFWTSLVSEIALYFLSGRTYFCWPLTGFATAGILYFVIDFLNTLDRRNNE